jgi:hypothetical protein
MTTTEQLDLSDKSTLQFSYGQFLAYDQSESEPGSLWTDRHIAQGFVRRSKSLGIGTLVQFGSATVRTFSGTPSSIDDYDRVISVPIELPSGILCIEGPEEYPIQRSINVVPGVYRLVAAQSLVSDTELGIDIFLESLAETTANSEILKADETLETSGPLLETGDVAP